MPPALGERVSRLLGAPVSAATRAAQGYTPAERWAVVLADGRRAFVKAAVDELTAGWLRTEERAYADIAGPFMPQLLAWSGEELPLLVLEDLTEGAWPPLWTADGIAAVMATLAEVAATAPPGWLPAMTELGVDFSGWHAVADDPAPFLSLGMVTPDWLEAALPTLISAQDACPLAGDQLLHGDVRSDNICLRDGRALLVDWNWTCTGNPRLDLALWLPSLVNEGGPEPEAMIKDAGSEAALVSGFFAARAGLPQIPTAPRVRTVQQTQIRHALPWVCRELGLPKPS
jgi:hypothetical protein